MNTTSFWIAAAGFLLAFQPGADLKTPRWTNVLWRCFIESAEVFVHMALLLALYGQIARVYPEARIGECFPLYYALGAYVLKILRQKNGTFLTISLILGLSFSGFEGEAKTMLLRAETLAAGTCFSAMLLVCAQRRILFSRQPAALQGAPQTFLLAAFLFLALHSLEGFFGF